ncbi:MAG: hypothetical protein JWP30_1250 [Homoserinimonas sp.]|jgi:hypothetical protein|nr:hypothetical protein [Homoserinimonas sp.]
MKVDEAVAVELSSTGSPVRFRWRGVVYGVISAPEIWVTRQDWWRLAGRAPRGAGQRLLEVKVWRVDALPLTDGARRIDGTFDLTKNPITGEWHVASVFDDERDQQLWA